ncbi:methylated-DNA--[protein]-cysteine S-methyltransferase [Athalassotoga sp.]|uniref:methylated-DNA--[protein]-cysteine S-methyltransferase n=1 Tax=Athalassotoga sp. TaxID=2022597 RepID=UPI003D057EDC
MSNFEIAYYKSPIGTIKITGTDDLIYSVDFTDEIQEANYNSREIQNCIFQLDEYFAGKRKIFSINYILNGTDFQKRVWNEMANIPFGKVVSYKDIAISIGYSKAVRAVGSAVGKNPMAIIIPCHRVVKSDGTIGNYGGGQWRKLWLLDHEGNKSGARRPDS